MNFNEIQDLIKLVSKSNLTTFKLKQKEFEIVIKTDKDVKSVVMPTSAAPLSMATVMPSVVPNMVEAQAPIAAQDKAPADVAESAAPATNKKLLEIKSPIVGTFYRASGPDKAPFVKIGDKITAGNVVCIIEAMKLFNEIESEISGTVFKVLVEDASPVEYDQVLFLVEA